MQTIGSWFNIPVLAVIIQALIFALLHPYNILGSIEMVIQGIIFGFLAWKTNGLEPGSAIHSVNNFTATIFVALGFDALTSTITPKNFVINITFSLVNLFVLYYIGKKQGWFSEKTTECKLI